MRKKVLKSTKHCLFQGFVNALIHICAWNLRGTRIKTSVSIINGAILYKSLIFIDIFWWLKNDQFNGMIVFTRFTALFQTFVHKVIHRKCGKNGFLHMQKELARLCEESTLSVPFNSSALPRLSRVRSNAS